MQPTLCSRCKKNVAVIFITRIENGESHNEGLCLRCARELHIKPVDEMMEKLGISDADLDNLTGDVAEMLGSMGMLGGDGAADADADASDADTDEDDGKTATFPFLNRLFNQPPAQDAAAAASEPPHADGSAADKRGAAPRKLKFLNNYCIDLTQRARDGKLDPLCVRDFCEFCGYTETEFWAILDKFYNRDLFEKNEYGEWQLKHPIWEENK